MHPNQLPIPPDAQNDSRARELLRLWAAHGKQHVSLATNLWEDPAAWGIMLVDLAKHVASAYRLNRERKFDDILGRIREGFDAEWENATDEPMGEIQD
jgi:hypothetical protein